LITVKAFDLTTGLFGRRGEKKIDYRLKKLFNPHDNLYVNIYMTALFKMGLILDFFNVKGLLNHLLGA